MYILDGIYQSAVCFFIPNFSMMDVVLSSGLNGGKFHLSTMVAFCVVVTVNLGVGVDLRSWSWVGTTLMMMSVFVLFGYFPVYTQFSFSDLQGLDDILFGMSFFLILIITVFLSLLPRFVLKYFNEVVYPNDTVIIRERRKYNMELNPSHFKPPPAPIKEGANIQFNIHNFNVKSGSGSGSRFSISEDRSINNSHLSIASSHSKGEDGVNKRLSGSFLNMSSKTEQPITGYAFSQDEDAARLRRDMRN
jgi:hypothetical protein